MRNLKLALLGLAGTALIAAAGCGGDEGGGGEELSTEDYASEVREVLDRLGSDLREIGDVVSESENVDQLAESVRSAEDEIQSVVDDLESIEPPSEAQRAHDLLIGALNAFNDALEEVSAAAESGEAERIISTATELPPAVAELQSGLDEARNALRDAGIDIAG